MKNIKILLTDLLQTHQSFWGKLVGYLLVFTILLSIVIFVLETTHIRDNWGPLLKFLEMIVIIIFTLEYVLRLFIARKKSEFVFSPLALVDLCVILSFYGHFLNLTFLRSLRIFRVLQLLRITGESKLMSSFFRAFRYYLDEIKIFILTLFIVLFLSSSGFYYLEHSLNPRINNIFDSFWWSIVTIFTVGYGDTVPETIGGKVLATFIMFFGLATIAIMTALITKVFLDHFFGKKVHHCSECHFPYHDNDARYCKNCGSELDTERLHDAEHYHIDHRHF